MLGLRKLAGVKTGADGALKPSAEPPRIEQLGRVRDVEDQRIMRRKSGRTQLYHVRVSTTFEGDIKRWASTLTAARGGKPRVTDGAVLDMMLDAFEAAQRNSENAGQGMGPPAAPKEVWEALADISNKMGMSPAVVLETLLFEKLEQIGLVKANAKPQRQR